MKDSEKGLLALALVGVYLYSSKKKPLTPVPGGFKSRKEEEIFVRAMTPQQREAYMTKHNITGKF